jgi:hypothetical protein
MFGEHSALMRCEDHLAHNYASTGTGDGRPRLVAIATTKRAKLLVRDTNAVSPYS